MNIVYTKRYKHIKWTVKHIKRVPSPGVEPGSPKPQSGVLPLYYKGVLQNKCESKIRNSNMTNEKCKSFNIKVIITRTTEKGSTIVFTVHKWYNIRSNT